MVLPRAAEWGQIRLPRLYRVSPPRDLRTPQLTFPFVAAPHPAAEKIIDGVSAEIQQDAWLAVERARKTPLVYTSFDGDHMHLVDSMCYVTHSLGSVPVNPEAALGYYISTTHHVGTKTEVMRDCVALEMACEEFWVFSRKSIIDSGRLPEGVIAELMLWKKWKPTAPIRFFDLDEIDACFFDSSSAACALPVPHPRLPGAGESVYEEILGRHTPTDVGELHSGFLQDVDDNGLRPLAFLSVDPLELKHIDWARLKVYSLGKVPFSPDTLVRYFPLRVASHTDFANAYSTARTALLLKANELFVFLRPPTGSTFTNPCRQVLQDLASWKLAGKPMDQIHFLTWHDADVPKFHPSRKWALTTGEDRVNRGSPRSYK